MKRSRNCFCKPFTADRPAMTSENSDSFIAEVSSRALSRATVVRSLLWKRLLNRPSCEAGLGLLRTHRALPGCLSRKWLTTGNRGKSSERHTTQLMSKKPFFSPAATFFFIVVTTAFLLLCSGVVTGAEEVPGLPGAFPLILMNSERESSTVNTGLRTMGRGALAGSERCWMGSSCSALSWKAGDSMMR